MKKHWTYLLAIGAFFSIGWVVVTFTQFRESVSNSLEGVHYILFVKIYPNNSFENTVLKRGDIVYIEGFVPAYVGEKNLTKRILGLPGDLIIKDENHIKISSPNSQFKAHAPKGCMPKACIPKVFMGWHIGNGKRLAETYESQSLPLQEKTSDGKPLTPISAKYVPERYVFVAGDHPQSFDSRYEEFGLVPIEKIKGKAVLWW